MSREMHKVNKNLPFPGNSSWWDRTYSLTHVHLPMHFHITRLLEQGWRTKRVNGRWLLFMLQSDKN